MTSQFTLLKDRRFLPLFVTQSLGAFNDNLMKAFFVIMVAYGLWDTGYLNPELIVSISAGLFILPFVFFCTLAGQITDKYDKAKIIRIIKFAEIVIVLVGIAAIYMQSITLAMIVLFALGTQSAFFSPGKLALLPQQLNENELLGANGLISTSTFLSILIGTIAGTMLAPIEHGIIITSTLLLLAAVAGVISSFYILPAPSSAEQKVISGNIFKSTFSIFKYARSRPHGVFAAMLCGSWFYFIASTIHAQFPNFAKFVLGVDTTVLSLFLLIFSMGVALGGLLNNILLRSAISAKLVPWSALAMAFFTFDIYFASLSFALPDRLETNLINLTDFTASLTGWRLLIDMFLLALAGGLYIVPLRTIVQNRTNKSNTARVVAANSMMDALLILTSSILVTVMLSIGFRIDEIFLCLSFLTLGVGIILFIKKPFQIKSERSTENAI